MTGLERELSELVRRAERTAGFGSAGDDAELESDLDDYLQRETGAGWDMETSRSLDPHGRSPVREAAWWLSGRGVDICAIHADSVGTVATAIDERVGIDTSPPASEEGTNHEIDVVAYDAPEDAVYLVQVTTEDLDELDDVSEEPLRSVIRTKLWLSSDEIDVVPSVCGPGSTFGVVERDTATTDEDDSSGHRVRQVEPPGADGPPPEELRFAGSKSDVLRAVPPCDGAVAGVAAMELLLERTESKWGSDPTTEPAIRRRVADDLGVAGLRERVTATIGESSLFSRVKVGPNRYVYLNPGGVVTAAVLLGRLGVSVSTSEAMETMQDSKKTFGRTLSQVEKHVQEAKRRTPERPYGVLPDLFGERDQG